MAGVGNLDLRSYSEIASTVEALRRAAARLADVAQGMQQRGMQDIPLFWVERQFAAVEIVTAMCKSAEAEAEAEFYAHDNNRISKNRATMNRTQRDKAKKLQRREESGAPKKPRGRPKKGATS